jgi:hypothetical protein
MTELTKARADALWREHRDQAWPHFRTNPVYQVKIRPKPDISFRRVDQTGGRMQTYEVVNIVHETEDMPVGPKVGWRVKIGPWIVAEGDRRRQTHTDFLRTAHL